MPSASRRAPPKELAWIVEGCGADCRRMRRGLIRRQAKSVRHEKMVGAIALSEEGDVIITGL
jgi:hypothetical protein